MSESQMHSFIVGYTSDITVGLVMSMNSEFTVQEFGLLLVLVPWQQGRSHMQGELMRLSHANDMFRNDENEKRKQTDN